MSTTIPPNNNTGLYNTTGTPIPVDNNILANNISATGNVTVGGYILANGSITTESNFVGDLLGNVSATGSVVANAVYTNNYLYANGQPFSGGGSGTYGNANVAAYLPTYGGTVLANLINFTNNSGVIEQGDQRITITGNATGVNTGAYFNDTGEAAIFANSYVAIATNTTGNINPTWTFDQLGNLSAPGNITAVGNIAGSYIFGNGSQLTGLPATYTDANVNTHLANFGSNVISTTGNITAGYFFGNGSQLTGLPATYGNSNVAAYLPTYSGNLNPNTISAAGNITGVNLQTSGAFGNITGANYITASYFVGDGHLLTNVTATSTYANSNVTSLLAAFGSNTISTTGNIYTGNILTNGYYYANGAPFAGGGSTYGNSNVNTLLAAWGSNTLSTTGTVNAGNITGGNILTGGVVTATGRITAGAVTYANTDGTTGQVLTTYGNGTTYFSTVSGGSGSPGGANTQIQYNNGGAFAGNGLMTFDQTTGNIGLGNLILNTNTIQTNVAIALANATISGTTTPWRVTIGNAYNGSTNSIYTIQGLGTLNNTMSTPRLLVADLQTMPNTGVRMMQQSNQLWANLSANISNTSTRFATLRNDLYIGGGTSGYTISATNTPTLATVISNQGFVGAGTNANLSLIGNVVYSAGMAGSFNGVTVSTNSSANLIVGHITTLTVNNPNATSFGNATTMLGSAINLTGAPANANITGTSTAIAYYMPGPNQIIPGYSTTTGNIPRMATDYWSFRSDDDLARVQLGSLSRFHEYTANTTSSSGTLVINKTNGQVQQIYPTENITTVTFSNFVTQV